MIYNNIEIKNTGICPNQKPIQAYDKWTPESDMHLKYLNSNNRTIEDLSHRFGRSTGAIKSRLFKIYYKRM